MVCHKCHKKFFKKQEFKKLMQDEHNSEIFIDMLFSSITFRLCDYNYGRNIELCYRIITLPPQPPPPLFMHVCKPGAKRPTRYVWEGYTLSCFLLHILTEECLNFCCTCCVCRACIKMDGVGPVDNRPSTDKLYHLFSQPRIH